MDIELLKIKFIECTITPEENRILFDYLKKNGGLYDLLLTNSICLFFYSKEQLLEYFTLEEVDEIEEIREKYKKLFDEKYKRYLSNKKSSVAEGDIPFGN